MKEKKHQDKIKIYLLLFVAGLFTQPVASFLLTKVISLFPAVEAQYAQNISNLIKMTPLVILWVCVACPIMEELIFRKLVLGLGLRFLPMTIANTIQAALFGLYHGNLVQGIYAFILGMVIGYIYICTRSVICTMLYHIGINCLGMVIDKIVPDDSTLVYQVVIVTISLLITATCMCFANKIIKRDRI